MSAAAIGVARNHYSLFQQCIFFHDAQTYAILIVDNATEDQTYEWLLNE